MGALASEEIIAFFREFVETTIIQRKYIFSEEVLFVCSEALDAPLILTLHLEGSWEI